MQSLSGKLASLNHFLSKSAERSLPFLDTLKKCTNKKGFRWTHAAKAVFFEMKKLVSDLPTLTTPKKGETLMFLAAADESVSAVLLTKIDGRKMPIHYVSRSLQGAETNYDLMEKLTLALVHAARRLRRYFQAHPIKVVASTLRVEDIPESSNAMGNLIHGLKAWRLYTDEASNSRGFGAGLILISPHDVEYSYALRLNFSNSNNDDEYEALLDGLRIATEMQLKDIHAFVNSKLVASKVVAKAMNMGYYWPSMHIDVRELIRACDDCQAHASVPRLPKADMILITSAWPFMK
uniref:Reverse transcriptase domain-containing protein n=1 Tax=Tanacetum cinerariifolium TaxID=118510 RepID=A0A699L6P1_TANCI|nr:reverse transcriptase domain-containing protein [Tanacetum cinerariifolium]